MLIVDIATLRYGHICSSGACLCSAYELTHYKQLQKHQVIGIDYQVIFQIYRTFTNKVINHVNGNLQTTSIHKISTQCR